MEIRARRRFPRLSPTSFTHPLDTAALNTLKSARGLDYVTKMWMEWYGERLEHIFNVSNYVMVGPKQCAVQYDQLRLAASVLDMPLPKMYVAMTPVVNAWTYGVTNPSLVVTTGLIELMDDEEVLAVIAHELGHILCGHSMYRTMAKNIHRIVDEIGKATMGVGKLIGTGLVYAMLEWARKSEYSADRAALLVTQDPDVMVGVMMKFAGGTGKLAGALNKEQFLKQADEYDKFDESSINVVYKVLQQVEMTHPIPILRAREIVRFAEDPQFKSINAGGYAKRASGSEPCDTCASAASPSDPYCPRCGQPRTSAEGRTADGKRKDGHCPHCYAAVPPQLSQCPVCTKPI